MGLFDWFKPKPPPAIPAALWQQTLARYDFLAALTVDEQNRLKTLAEEFLACKEFTTGGGLVLSDEICVTIAAQGCLPILQLGLSAYSGWVGIVVYPDEFVVRRAIHDDDGIVHEYDDVLAGEAWAGGPLILSWRDVQLAGQEPDAASDDSDDEIDDDSGGPGYNVVIHEFAHKLDMLNGEVDGIPALHSGLDEASWDAVFLAAFDDFCRRVDSGEETIIDPYAASEEGEFFAVFSEAFFLLPAVVDREYPELYTLLCRYYRQDPLSRSAKPTIAASTAAS